MTISQLEREGKERKGKGRKGKERKGKERKGKGKLSVPPIRTSSKIICTSMKKMYLILIPGYSSPGYS